MSLLLLLACAPGTDDSAGPLALTAPTPTLSAPVRSVRYHLAWDTGRLEPGERSWTVTTDRGDRVTLVDGWISTRTLALVPCPDPRPAALGALSLLVGPARACEGSDDVSARAVDRVDPLVAPADVDLGGVGFAVARYCQLFTLLAKAHADAEGESPAVGMVDTTLRLRGSWSGDAGGGTFDLETDEAWGANLALPRLPAPDVDLTLTRDLGGLFDGVDFTAPPVDITRQVLRNLSGDARVTVQARAPTGVIRR